MTHARASLAARETSAIDSAVGTKRIRGMQHPRCCHPVCVRGLCAICGEEAQQEDDGGQREAYAYASLRAELPERDRYVTDGGGGGGGGATDADDEDNRERERERECVSSPASRDNGTYEHEHEHEHEQQQQQQQQASEMDDIFADIALEIAKAETEAKAERQRAEFAMRLPQAFRTLQRSMEDAARCHGAAPGDGRRGSRAVLVLDLDHTLVHSVHAPELALLSETRASAPYFLVAAPGCVSKLRPGARTFIAATAKVFDVCVYTWGTCDYAHRICAALDPERRGLIKGVVTREFHVAEGRCLKSLDVLRAVGIHCDVRRTLIIDDSPHCWVPEHALLVMRPPPYLFFPAESGGDSGSSSESLSRFSDGFFAAARDEQQEDVGAQSEIMTALAANAFSVQHTFFFSSSATGGISSFRPDYAGLLTESLATTSRAFARLHSH